MNKLPKNLHDSSFKAGNLVELLRWRAETQPNKRAYTYLKDGENKEIQLTYGELDKRARAIAVSLQQKGLTGERALLLYPPGLDYISGFFGCLYAGVIAVPAYPPDPNRLNRSLPRLQAIVNDAEATIALTTDSIYYMIKMLKLGSKFTSTFDKLPVFRKFKTSMKYFATSKGAIVKSRELGDLDWVSTDSIASGLADEWKNPPIDSETIAFLQYTSGSTGTPKGVILTHENLLHNSEIIKNSTAFSDHAEGVFWLPIYHDMGLIGGVLQPLYREMPSTLMSPLAFLQRPLRWLEVISKLNDREVASAAPNFAYELCIKKATPEKVKQLNLSHWTYALSGAEPVRHQTLERFAEIFKPAGFKKSAFYPAYGLAEATLLVTASDFHKPPVNIALDKELLKKNKIQDVPSDAPEAQIIVSCGKNQPTQETIIVNPEKLILCTENEIGEIWVKGKSVSRGYYRREDETRETFQNYLADTGEGPFLRTGDLGFIRNDEVFITGRVKDLIIIRGTNHYPQDIEVTVEQCHPEIRPGCAAAFTVDANDQEQLVVVLEIRHNKNVDFDAIIQSVRQAISEDHDLQAYSIVLIKARTINKTSSGKIQRRATRQDFLDNKLSVLAQWESSTDTLPIVSISEEDDFMLKTDELESAARSLLAKDKLALQIEDWLIGHLADTLKTDKKSIDIRQPFISFGLDSAHAVGLAGDLEEWLERELPPTLIWDYPTIEALARHLASEEVETIPLHREKHKPTTEHEPIAIIGYSLRMPGAKDAKEFWQNLVDGVDAISEVPPERWNVDEFYDPNPGAVGKMITRWGGFLEDVDKFDAQFFGISPREAAHIDPQQRLLLEAAWEALEEAGQTWDSLANKPVGVFVGISGADYSRLQSGDFSRLDAYSGTGNAFSIAANRISFVFDLKGPSFPVDTACSSSLIAVHNAVSSLRRGESSMALAAGVNLILAPDITITFSQARMMAADGRCKTFDDSADGYVRGEGVGVVILKRLSDAIRDGDPIRAIIRGSAINQDGRSNGITAPNGLAQQAVIRLALRDAHLQPNQVGFFETHGTGTTIGDPIEINALRSVMAESRSEDQPLVLGSVKTNIGHLESAAGIAGLIKTIMVLENEYIPKTLHFKKLNQHIKLDGTNIFIATEGRVWRRGSSPRFAGVSAYGFGGANAHIILQEAPDMAKTLDERDIPVELNPLVLPVSAHSPEAARALAERYARFLDDEKFTDNEKIIDMIYSASVRRSQYEDRAAVIGRTQQELIEALQALAHGENPATVVHGSIIPNANTQLVFVFSGQGPQWFAMGRQLMEKETVYRQTIEDIDKLLREYTAWSLLEELNRDEETTKLAETEIAQPAIFAMQVALSRLWAYKGIRPAAVVGHSVGEIAAAHVSGTLSLKDAVKVIYHRSRLMQKATGFGRMASVELPLEGTAKAIKGFEDKLSLGAHNSPTNTVISGEPQAIETVVKKLEADGVFVRMLKVNYAFHSPQMDPYKEELIRCLEGIEVKPPVIPIYSTVSGKLSIETDYNPVYWANNIRERVNFSSAVSHLIDNGFRIFLELAPHPVLSASLGQCLREKKINGTVLASVRRMEDELMQMAASLASLYTLGLSLDWEKQLPAKGRFIPLPALPWQKERYWFDLKGKGPQAAPLYRRPIAAEIVGHPLLGGHRFSPLNPGKHYWETEISLDILPYLEDHKVQESVVLPATGYLEMAFSAASEAYGHPVSGLTNVSIFRALFLPEDKGTRTQFILTPYTNGQASFQIFSLSTENPEKHTWNMHTMGMVFTNGPSTGVQPEYTLDELKVRCQANLSVSDFYHNLRRRGLQYGPHFQEVQELYTGQNEALGRVLLPENLQKNSNDYQIHPALLDACFHVLSAAIPADQLEESQDTYMPVAIQKMMLFEKADGEAWSYARFAPNPGGGNDVLLGDIMLYNGQGQLLAEIQGLKLQRLGQRRETDLSDWFYKLEWQEAPAENLEIKAPEADQGDGWIILADADGIAIQLAEQLKSLNQHVLLVHAGRAFNAVDETQFEVNPQNPDDFIKLMQSVSNPEQPPIKGILHLWNLDTRTEGDAAVGVLSDIIHRNLGSALFLAQAVLSHSGRKAPQLFFITRGLFKVNDEAGPLNLFQAPFWGLGRVISSENPDMACIKIDLPSQANEGEIKSLLHEIWSPDREDQIALRNGKRFALRLMRSREHYQPDEAVDDEKGQLLEIPEQPFELDIAAPGVLSALRYKTVSRLAPSEGQVEIEVHATGLNFRDVLMALGLYPGDPIPLGSECSGVISRVGPGVKGLQEGDAVLAVAPHTFGKYVTTVANLVVPKPSALSFEEGATIPITFLTAYYAMVHLGRLQQGERVLIHAGAGGVGQAAIQIAQMIGAEIFATAGNDEKRAFLKSMGVNHVLDSRTLDFADEIMSITSGAGVDMILNSLAGEFIPRSLAMLKPYGRFLEIGKTDIYQNSQIDLYPFRRNLSYFAIDLDMVLRDKPQLGRELFLELIGHFESGKLKSLPLTHFSASEVVSAFRYMAQRKNIGKIVVSMNRTSSDSETASADEAMTIRPEATYLITGGVGALGLLMAEWLVNRGARHLALLTIADPGESAQDKIEQLKKQGVEVVVTMGDVTSLPEMENIFKDISANMPPVKGILHLAGILDDHPYSQMSWEQMQRVLAPKVQGSWVLHQLTRKMELDFFILFSSVASVIGNPGQANYAAANFFLDQMASYRQSLGLPVLTINWGFWESLGLVTEKKGQTKIKGSRLIKPESGLQIMDRLIHSDIGQTVITPVVWSELLEPFPKDRIPPLYRLFEDQKIDKTEMAGAGLGSKTGITANQLQPLSAAERLNLIAEYLRQEIARVVGVSASKLELDKPLNTMGIDSLMAIELKNSVESSMEVSLPIATLLKGPAIMEMAADLVEQLMSASAEESETDTGITIDDAEHPASFGQRAMWFQHQLAPASIYNQVYAVRIPDKLDVELLRRSIEFLCRRHLSLRTNFIYRDGRPERIIHDEPNEFLQVIDVAGKSDIDIKEMMYDHINQPFDLEHDTLTRIIMFSLAENDHIFLFIGHHIISDMWSLAIFMYELNLVYSGGGQAELPVLSFDYGDYVKQQNRMLAGTVGRRHQDYWLEQLKGDLPILNLPTDFPRPAIQTYAGRTESIRLDPSIKDKLTEISERHGATLFSTLLAAFKVLLYRYCGQEDLIVGTPTTGRTSPEYAPILGYFVNPVAIRSRVDGHQTFGQYLETIGTKVVEALDHQDYPFNLIVEKLHPRRDPSRTPIFQLMFVYQKAYLLHDSGMSGMAVEGEGGSMKLGDITLESFSVEHRVLPFDLTMLMAELDDGLGASLEYNVALFRQETAIRLLQHFKNLLQAIAADSQRPISDYNFLSDEELHSLLRRWNQTAVPVSFSCCVHEFFQKQSEKTPQSPAVYFNGRYMSYGELNIKANQLARYLVDRGVGPDVIVGISAERCIEMIIAIIAILKAGGAYLPLDPAYPNERLAYMLDDSGVTLLLTQKKLEGRLPQGSWQNIYLEEVLEQVAGNDTDNFPNCCTPLNLAYVIYTSGSTGRPKGVMLTHAGLGNLTHAQIKEFHIDSASRLLQFASFSFDAAASEIFTTLFSGATLYLVDQETLLSGPDLVQYIRENEITTVTLPPSVLRVLPVDELPSLQHVISAGEDCTPDIAGRWSENRHLINAYGPTEGTICASLYHVTEIPDGSSVPIGKAIDNVRIYILDEFMNPVPIGVPGEFHIAGAGVARGYLNRPDRTAEKFIPDPFSGEAGGRMYKTGDLVRIMPDGNIEFLGRIDQQVKIRGFRIELGEIEARIKEHEEVLDAAVIAYGGVDKRLVAYLVPSGNGEFNGETIKYHLRMKLPDYMIPATVIQLDKFPLTANGKIDYKALPKPDVKRADFVKAETETERKLADIWQEILNLEQVGINDNFFELGGHSLNIVQMQNHIKERFEREINVVDLFRFPTISSLAQFMNDGQQSRDTREKTEIRVAKQRKAMDAQKERMISRRRNR